MLTVFDRLRKSLLLLVVTLLSWLTINLTIVSLAAESPAPEASEFRPEQMVPRSGLDSSDIPSEKVSQFVHACLQVVALIEQREGELQGAETESESVRIEQEIEAEALAIIENAGLSRQEYLQLLGLANTDPEFGERIATQLQEATS